MTPNEQKADTPEVTRAAEVLYGISPPLTGESWHECDLRYARALSAAGLIVTDEDVLNRELAEAMVERPRNGVDAEQCGPKVVLHFASTNAATAFWAARRAILAAKKPKERWTVETVTPTTFFVREDGAWRASFDSEPYARGFAAQRNAEEGK